MVVIWQYKRHQNLREACTCNIGSQADYDRCGFVVNEHGNQGKQAGKGGDIQNTTEIEKQQSDGLVDRIFRQQKREQN